MLQYRSGGKHTILNMFRCSGSVFPYTMLIAICCGIVSGFVNVQFPDRSLSLFAGDGGIMVETQAWAGFSFLLGFLIVFRTTQAYSRFWEGTSQVYRMRAEWFDALSSIIAFTKFSKEEKDKVTAFRELIIRLCSMLHAAALAELEGGAREEEAGELWSYNFPIIDPSALNEDTVATVSQCRMKVDLIFQWLQNLIVEQISTGVMSIPPPILSRSFQELANGMVAYHDAVKLVHVPFPFPYAQACDGMLLLHWLIVPIVTSQWVTNPIWAAVFTFVQVFILWSLNLIAIEIDQPFGTDANDIDGDSLQMEMNEALLQMVDERSLNTPFLVESTTINGIDEEGKLADVDDLVASRAEGGNYGTLRNIMNDAMTKKSRRRGVMVRHSVGQVHSSESATLARARSSGRLSFTEDQSREVVPFGMSKVSKGSKGLKQSKTGQLSRSTVELQFEKQDNSRNSREDARCSSHSRGAMPSVQIRLSKLSQPQPFQSDDASVETIAQQQLIVAPVYEAYADVSPPQPLFKLGGRHNSKTKNHQLVV